MRTSRLPVILPALLLLLSLPATADMRGIPAPDGHPQATIEGTITSINIPFAGGGPIVTLLDGLVAFDATGAAVRFADGREGTTSALAAGQRVLAILDPTASPLRATTVVILSNRADVTLTGKADAVDTAARTLTVLGFQVRVTDRTVFGGPWEGTGQKGLGDVKVGDLVLVDARAESGSLLATKVMKLAPSPDPTVRIHGVVGAIGTEAWTIGLPDGTRTVVKVDAQTKINGDPKVGDEVDVLARRQSDGSLLALLIMKSVPPPPVPTERYRGVVKAIGATSWTIGPKAGDGPDRHFAVNARTQILGAPKVGDEVGVLAQKQADGSFLALFIAKLEVTPPVGTEVTFEGVVKSISPGTSTGTTMGTWVVGETKVLVTRMTVVRGDPKVGDKVRVEGLKSSDGSVMASRIQKL